MPDSVDTLATPASVTIDGRDYQLESLSAEAREQLARLSATDRRLQQLQVELVIAQTARASFAQQLKQLLPA
jgi:hypothetical protein